MTSARYTVLAGGTGAAKFLRGLVQVVPEDNVDVIVNVGDDAEMWGLHISPDIDSVAYGLANKLDRVRGWGLENETFHCLDTIRNYGMPSWFRIGDRDLATHLTRTQLLKTGLSLTDTVERMTRAIGIGARILPATNDRVRTKIETPNGTLDFQEFFVRHSCQAEVTAVAYAGATEARASSPVLQSIRDADIVIVAPSNPITSIGPMLALHDLRDALRCTRAEVIAISPLIGKSAVSGPAAKLMQACGYEVSPSGIARCYHDFLDNIVLDRSDAAFASSIRFETIGVQFADILMVNEEAACRLAQFVVALGESERNKK